MALFQFHHLVFFWCLAVPIIGFGFGFLSVEDFPEDETMRRSAHAGSGAVGFGEHGFDIVRGEFSSADLDEGTDDAAAHFVEEAVAFDVEGNALAGFFKIATGEGAHGVIDLVAMIGREGAEIVFAHEHFRGGAHGVDIEFAGHMPGVGAEQGIHRMMIPHEVAVLFAGGIEAGVERFRGAGGVEYADVIRQEGIQGDGEADDGHLELGGGDLEMGDHAEGMHAGIRTAGAMEPGLAGKIAGEDFLDLLLHAGANLLELPALVGGAVVGDDEFEFLLGG